MGRKNNCQLNFFSMYFVRNNAEIHLSLKIEDTSFKRGCFVAFDFTSLHIVFKLFHIANLNIRQFSPHCWVKCLQHSLLEIRASQNLYSRNFISVAISLLNQSSVRNHLDFSKTWVVKPIRFWEIILANHAEMKR